MTSDRIRRLATEVAPLGPDPIVKEDPVVIEDRVLFVQPNDTEVQRALNQWDKGKSEKNTNEVRQKQQERHPDYKDLGSLSEFVSEDRKI